MTGSCRFSRPVLEDSLGPTLERGSCPHLAALLKSDDELPGVLASFYALGASRAGWLVHRAPQGRGESDRESLAQAGLDVAELEAGGRFAVVEFDPAEAPETWTEPWAEGLEGALERGFSGLWYSRFAIGPDDDHFAAALPYERAWEEAFHGRPVVTLCPYIVGGLSGGAVLERISTLAAIHDGMLVSSDEGFAVVHRDNNA